MVEFIYNLSLQNICKTKQLEEKNIIISTLAQKLEKTVKYLEEIKKENAILQENISKIFVCAKSECDKKNYKIYKLKKKLNKYLSDKNPNNDNETKSHRKKRKKEEKPLEELEELEKQNCLKEKSPEKITCYPDKKKGRIDEDIKDQKSQSVQKDSYRRESQSVQRDQSEKKDHRDYYRRSRSRSRERRRGLSPKDLRNRINSDRNHYRSRSRDRNLYRSRSRDRNRYRSRSRDRYHYRSRSKDRSPCASKSRDYKSEDTIARETRLLLQKIRKNQEAMSSTSAENSPAIKRDFLKELNKKSNDNEGVLVNNTGETNEILSISSVENLEKNTEKLAVNLLEIKEITSSESESNILEPKERNETVKSNLEDDEKTIDLSNEVLIEEKSTCAIEKVSCDIKTNDNAISDVIDDEEISNDIFDELTQILNEIHEDESQKEIENETENDNSKKESSFTLSDMSIEEGEIDEDSEELTKIQQPSSELNEKNGSTSTLSDISFDDEKISSKKEINNKKIVLETNSKLNSHREIKITINDNSVIEHKYHSRTKKRSHAENKGRKSFHENKVEQNSRTSKANTNDNQHEFRKPTMKFEDPFNTKDWREDPLTYVPKSWKDMRLYDDLEYVDDGKKTRASCDVEPIESSESNFGSQSSSFSPECPF